jgi:hypothetical protein
MKCTRRNRSLSESSSKTFYESNLVHCQRCLSKSFGSINERCVSSDSVIASVDDISASAIYTLVESDCDDVCVVRCDDSRFDDSLETAKMCGQLNYRRLCVFLQEGRWKHCPHAVHCITASCNITLVIIHEVSTISAAIRIFYNLHTMPKDPTLTLC